MVGDRVKDERARRGWTQRDLAVRSGLGQSYISQLESGRRDNPTSEVLLKLARAFAIAIDELLLMPAEDNQIFPSTTLRNEGLPEVEIVRISALWEQYPEKRKTLLESAHNLAQAHAKLNRLTAELQ